MSYTLGLDIGTTGTTAAVNDGTAVRVFTHPSGATVVPSVVALTESGDLLVGEDAERRAVLEPTAIARQFKRRFGDTTPLLLRGTPIGANDLLVQLATAVVANVTDLEGHPPDGLVVCHPANWGSFKVSLLSDTLTNSALPPHLLITEPQAAALHYASLERVQPGTRIAVYDLGGGTFDVALLSKVDSSDTPDSSSSTLGGWELVGRPGGIERLGGIDLDAALFHHIVEAAEIDLDILDDDDPRMRAAVRRLRVATEEAKISLSIETATTVLIDLPGRDASEVSAVRVTRAEFEQLIGPALDRTLESFDTTLADAGLTNDDLDLVLVVGGSSRIPLIAQRITSHTGLPVATDTHPKHVTALGAARVIGPTPPNDPGPIDGEEQTVGPLPGGQIGSLFPEIPHISEGPEPDFMSRRRVVPTTADWSDAVGSSATPPPTVEPSPVPSTTAQAPPDVVLESTSRHPGRRALLGAVLLLAGAGIGAVALLQPFGEDPMSDATTNGDETSAPSLPSTTTVLPDGYTTCPADGFPANGTSYRVVQISADDRDGGLNGRQAPALDAEVATVFPSMSPLQTTGACAVDPSGRPWWQVRGPDALVWVSARFVEAQP